LSEYTVLDSGKRQIFETGAQRDTQEGKGRYDLIAWEAIDRLALQLERGAVKYGDDNWRQGIPLKRYFDSAIRHIRKWQRGDRDEDHLAAALFNIMGALWTEEQLAAGNLPESLAEGLRHGATRAKA
jgi:hypothetical protein